jgi:galactofuranose transport system permease protein
MARVDRANSPSAPEPSLPNRLRQLGQRNGAAFALLALLLYNSLFTPNFLAPQTITVNLTQVATIVIVAIGMTLVIATGGIDLSVGSLMAIAGALAPLIFLNVGPPALSIALAFVVPILVAGLFGLFNGVLVTSLRIQPIIATLVLFIAGRGICKPLATRPFSISALDAPLASLSRSS